MSERHLTITLQPDWKVGLTLAGMRARRRIEHVEARSKQASP